MPALSPAPRSEPWPETVIFGGTFDPIGPQHVSAVRRLLNTFRTVVIAAGDRNPFKDWVPTGLAVRLEMIERVMAYEGIEVVDDPRKPGVYVSRYSYWYAYRFVEQWRAEHPDLPIAWAVGSDIAHEVKSWKNWDAVESAGSLPIYVLHRDPALGSSTETRTGERTAHPALEGFIQSRRLYEK